MENDHAKVLELEKVLEDQNSENEKLRRLVRAYRVGGNDALRHENIELNARLEALRYDIANLITDLPVKNEGKSDKEFETRMEDWKGKACAALELDPKSHVPLGVGDGNDGRLVKTRDKCRL